MNILIATVILDGSEQCVTPDGVAHTGPGCCGAAARHLISKGTSPKARIRFKRDGQTVMSGTIDSFAQKMWAGADRDPAMRKWRPDPRFPLPPALAKWWKELNR